MCDTPIARVTGCVSSFFIKIKIRSSCEIEDFVETHLSKLCVIRLSLDKLLVDILQVVKRIKKGIVDRPWVFLINRGFGSHIHHNKLSQTFPMSNLKNTLPGIPRK